MQMNQRQSLVTISKPSCALPQHYIPNMTRNQTAGNPPSPQAASFKGHADIAALLQLLGADPNAQGYQFGSVLQAASLQNHVEIVRLLLAGGADVRLKGEAWDRAGSGGTYGAWRGCEGVGGE
ncbi:hypothetical protein PAAG_08087 [Paracoccidioides lutzii Pb01]|uniref:Uncharacterized protein n=1 Tax=Paracoccidioides lutzii (strain ATCC MYA-826 / Pb01) TaxID=502779 RepID=C1HBE6_PARBA|nr:hypothetical protein PAAG_08087 [Paracoccidioides lutzii Pb01]EEH37669.2 hypothetical protein PAAG_08087 [Paracoccidioides lutzii Pb01]